MTSDRGPATDRGPVAYPGAAVGPSTAAAAADRGAPAADLRSVAGPNAAADPRIAAAAATPPPSTVTPRTVTPPRAAREFRVDRELARVYDTRADMGRAAARDVADALRALLRGQPGVRMVFAAAPSQDEMLAGLAAAADIDWARVTALHMDEYVGLDTAAPQRFGTYLRTHLFDRVRPGRVELIGGNGDAGVDGAEAHANAAAAQAAEPQDAEAADAEAEAARYARVLAEGPIDIVCAGIGENGHLAFNDPPTADFADPELVRVVALDERSRRQQVHDGCFARLADVPTRAITVTIPALLAAREVFCVVPGASKAAAVREALYGPVDASCPATILRRHPRCTLYLDAGSAPAPAVASSHSTALGGVVPRGVVPPG